MNLTKIHHVAIITSNYEATKHFYVDLLGFKIIREHYRETKQDYKIDLQLDGCELEIFVKPDSPKRATNPESLGLRHLSLQVESVQETVAELNRLGIQTEPIRLDDYTEKPLAFFYDPDNLPIELHE